MANGETIRTIYDTQAVIDADLLRRLLKAVDYPGTEFDSCDIGEVYASLADVERRVRASERVMRYDITIAHADGRQEVLASDIPPGEVLIPAGSRIAGWTATEVTVEVD